MVHNTYSHKPFSFFLSRIILVLLYYPHIIIVNTKLYIIITLVIWTISSLSPWIDIHHYVQSVYGTEPVFLKFIIICIIIKTPHRSSNNFVFVHIKYDFWWKLDWGISIYRFYFFKLKNTKKFYVTWKKHVYNFHYVNKIHFFVNLI